MTRAQREAHLRLISTLGTRTHVGQYQAERGQGVHLDVVPPSLMQEVRQMLADNCSDRMILRRLKLGYWTLRRIKKMIP